MSLVNCSLTFGVNDFQQLGHVLAQVEFLRTVAGVKVLRLGIPVHFKDVEIEFKVYYYVNSTISGYHFVSLVKLVEHFEDFEVVSLYFLVGVLLLDFIEDIVRVISIIILLLVFFIAVIFLQLVE